MSPLVTEADVEAVAAQMRSMWIGRGAKVSELEETMAAWVGARYAVALGSGTAALTLALMSREYPYVNIPPGVCEAVKIAVYMSGKKRGVGRRLRVYPDTGPCDIIDYARHLPKKGEVTLQAEFGIFSFGALKDVSGGIGGCVVANEPILATDFRKLSPISDINAAMILEQLKRYEGKTDRLVAGGKVWRL